MIAIVYLLSFFKHKLFKFISGDRMNYDFDCSHYYFLFNYKTEPDRDVRSKNIISCCLLSVTKY